MAWITPITDRAASDIAGHTSKAYFNVADWTRIYDNALIVRNEVQARLGISIPFSTLATPTTTTFPDVSIFNSLLLNIETMRQAAGSSGTTPILSDWVAGYSEPIFNYTHVNQWELTLLLIHTSYASAFNLRKPRTGIAAAGSGLTRNNKWRT